jgi:hypothetical protein
VRNLVGMRIELLSQLSKCFSSLDLHYGLLGGVRDYMPECILKTSE